MYYEYFVIVVLLLTAIFTYVETKFPNLKMPFIPKDKVWPSALWNFITTGIIVYIVWYVL